MKYMLIMRAVDQAKVEQYQQRNDRALGLVVVHRRSPVQRRLVDAP